jgi:carbon monoxide dehydrogenase subunit G
MRLENEFTVPVPVPQAWQTLLDVQRIAPCMPGAVVDRVEGDKVAGKLKVKLGPVLVSYSGTARFAEKDERGHRVVLEANGTEVRGSGTASATIQTQLHEQDSVTRVRVVTDLNVTGKAAQLGQGVMGDVAAKLVDQFAGCLAGVVRGEGGTEMAGAAGSPPGTVAQDGAARAAETAAVPSAAGEAPSGTAVAQPQPEALDFLGTVGLPVVKRAAPVLAGVALGLVLGVLVARRPRFVIVPVPAPGQPSARPGRWPERA